MSAREIAARLRTVSKLGASLLGIWALSRIWQVNLTVLLALGRVRLWDQPIDAANELYLTLVDGTAAVPGLALIHI